MCLIKSNHYLNWSYLLHECFLFFMCSISMFSLHYECEVSGALQHSVKNQTHTRVFKNATWFLETLQCKNIYIINNIDVLICTFIYFTYILNTEFSNGVVHQHSEVLQCHSDIPIHPAAFFWPVLVTLFLMTENHNHEEFILVRLYYLHL